MEIFTVTLPDQRKHTVGCTVKGWQKDSNSRFQKTEFPCIFLEKMSRQKIAGGLSAQTKILRSKQTLLCMNSFFVVILFINQPRQTSASSASCCTEIFSLYWMCLWYLEQTLSRIISTPGLHCMHTLSVFQIVVAICRCELYLSWNFPHSCKYFYEKQSDILKLELWFPYWCLLG